eukprot:TRINITY_DN107719_c0_g1_i1.p1 TRINITY_DN107719_c0_g1~~TRINITY_DN107719_c0_g1_i1.p1  ORF type:complete len:182 (-),score=14.41 TRINITY_DN107719_c0_g1_i1:91-600(-)
MASPKAKEVAQLLHKKFLGGVFNIQYSGASNKESWHQNTVVGISCLSYAVGGCLLFAPRGLWYAVIASLVTSSCSVWADYVHIEDTTHVAHLVDRVAAFHFTFLLAYDCAVVIGIPLWYLTVNLFLALQLFAKSRGCRGKSEWVLMHTAWHVVPMALLLVPDAFRMISA